MPNLQPPPYQDQQGTQRWSEWFRKINNLLSGLSISIGAADDVNITGATDGELLAWVNGSSEWQNKTIAELTPWLFGDGTESLPALSFVSDPDTGLYWPEANRLALVSGGSEVLRLAGSASHNLRVAFSSAAAPTAIVMSVEGAGAGTGANFTSNLAGAAPGNWDFTTTLGGLNPNFRIKSDGTNDTQYLQVTPAATTFPPELSSQGTDTNIGLLLTPKGTGQILAGGVLNMQSFNITVSDSDFILDESGNELMQWVTSGGATHYLRLRNASSATPLALTAESSTADANFTLKPKGTGYMTIANQHFSPAVVVTGATHTVVVGNRYLLCDTTSNAITVNLLAAATAGSGYRLDVKITNATNAVTIDASTTETIDGSLTLVLSNLYDNVSLLCDGSNWHII